QVARHLPVDDDARAAHLGLHHRALADDEGVLGRDLALDVTLDPAGPLEDHLAGDATPLAEEGARAARLAALSVVPLALGHPHLPRGRRGDRWGRLLGRPVTPLPILPEKCHEPASCKFGAAGSRPRPAPAAVAGADTRVTPPDRTVRLRPDVDHEAE